MISRAERFELKQLGYRNGLSLATNGWIVRLNDSMNDSICMGHYEICYIFRENKLDLWIWDDMCSYQEYTRQMGDSTHLSGV